MKALPLILAASLVANAALITVTLRHASSSGDDSDTAASRASAQTSSIKGKASPALDGVTFPPELLQAINGNDPLVLRDFLRAAGFSEEMVRTIVQSRVWEKYRERMKELNPPPNPDQPWWKNDRTTQNGRYGNRQTKAQRAEVTRLQREAQNEIQTLLGPDPNQQRWQDQRFAFLPVEKRDSLQKIQQDYQELIGEVQMDANGFQLQSDIDKLRFLEDEQRRDIEALLTPEERIAYDLRSSPTANQLRWQMTNLDASESEYLAIFPLQKAFDEKYNPQNQYSYGRNYEQPERNEAYWKERREAEAQLKQQIKSIIGEDRFAESVRLQDNDWRQLEAATARLQLPAETPAQLYSLREFTATAARQVADNTALTYDQKKQALADLASQTRDQVRTTLGTEGGDAYFKNNGMNWLKELERGRVVTFNQDDANWNTKALPKDPKKPAAPK